MMNVNMDQSDWLIHATCFVFSADGAEIEIVACLQARGGHRWKIRCYSWRGIYTVLNRNGEWEPDQPVPEYAGPAFGIRTTFATKEKAMHHLRMVCPELFGKTAA